MTTLDFDKVITIIWSLGDPERLSGMVRMHPDINQIRVLSTDAEMAVGIGLPDEDYPHPNAAFYETWSEELQLIEHHASDEELTEWLKRRFATELTHLA